MCCVMWSSACSSNKYRSWDAFTLVFSTQSVRSRQRAGRILERFLDTSSRHPSPGRVTGREKSPTNDSQHNESHVEGKALEELRNSKMSSGNLLQWGRRYSKRCWGFYMCKLYFFNRYCTILTPHHSENLHIFLTTKWFEVYALKCLQKGKMTKTYMSTAQCPLWEMLPNNFHDFLLIVFSVQTPFKELSESIKQKDSSHKLRGITKLNII